MNTPENNNFTALRLALALLVVLGHFIILPGNGPTYGLFAYSSFAVDMFFIVSGYLIFASFDKRPILGDFYIRRIFRIYPLYITVVILQGLIMAALAGGIMEHRDELLRYLGLNLIMANFLAHDIGGLLSGLHNQGINPSLWTLKIELMFYFLLPLLWVLTQRFGLWFLVLLYVASTAYATMTLHFGMDTLAKQLPGQMRFFVVGMALYRCRNTLTFPTLPAMIIGGGLFLLCHFYIYSPLILPIYPLCAGLLLYLCVFRLPVIPLPFDISYGVYLLHGPLIQFSLLLSLFSNSWTFLAILLATVVLLALAAERMIEQPGIELGKRLARGWSARFQRAEAA